MSLATWGDLVDYHCNNKHIVDKNTTTANPYHEDFSCRRYNYAPSTDTSSCRLVFLKKVLDNPSNKTLVRKGRFIWCKNLVYEGLDTDGLRQVSFTVDKGQKRFTVSEANMLCIPSKIYINNNRYFKTKQKTFSSFSTVFSYKNTINMMLKRTDLEREDFYNLLADDNPFRPGTLVSPRLGYFFPEGKPDEDKSRSYPYGIILGPSIINTDHVGREFYRVRFGGTTYEKVHPIQMEIVNEV